jgi:hypothetical protein
VATWRLFLGNVTAAAPPADDPAERPVLAALDEFELFEGLGFFDPGPFEDPAPPADDPAERGVAEAIAVDEAADEPGLFEPPADFLADPLDFAALFGVPEAEPDAEPGWTEPSPFELDDLLRLVDEFLAALDQVEDEVGYFEPVGPEDTVLNDTSEIVVAAALAEDEAGEQPILLPETLLEVPPAPEADDIFALIEASREDAADELIVLFFESSPEEPAPAPVSPTRDWIIRARRRGRR